MFRAVSTSWLGRLTMSMSIAGAIIVATRPVSSQAWSSWGRLQPVPSGPATPLEVGHTPSGRPVVFVLGTDGSLYHASEQTAPRGAAPLWTTWQRLAPPNGVRLVRSFSSVDDIGIGHFAVVANADGRLEVFAPGSDRRIWHAWEESPEGAWSEWASFDLPRVTPWSPEDVHAAANLDGTIEVYVKNGGNGDLYHIVQATPNGSWTSVWEHLNRPAAAQVSDIVALRHLDDGRQEIVTRGQYAPASLAQLVPSGYWADWTEPIGAPSDTLATLVGAVHRQDGGFALVGSSPTSIWTTTQARTGTWSGQWLNLDAPPRFLLSPVAVTRLADGAVGVFVGTQNGGLWVNRSSVFDNRWSGWTLANRDWSPLSNVRSLVATTGTDGRAFVMVLGTDKRIWWTSEPFAPTAIAPEPGSAMTPLRSLEATRESGSAPYVNPDPTAGGVVDGKSVCSQNTFMSGYDPPFEWMPVLAGEQVESRHVGVSGWAFGAHSSANDFWFSHPFGDDFNYDVAPDDAYKALIAPTHNTNGDRDRAIARALQYFNASVPDMLHVEIDQDFVPSIPGYDLRDGDRVAVFGRWIADCGHDDFHTEIHPPLLAVGARAVSASRTHAAVYSRRFVVNQEFEDGATYEHILKEMAKGGLIPFYQMSAEPSLLPAFHGTPSFDFVVRPPRSRTSATDQLHAAWAFQTRPGVSVSFALAGDDGVRVHVHFDEKKYLPPPRPTARTRTISFDELYAEILSHSRAAADGIQAARVLGGLVLSTAIQRGIETTRFSTPLMSPLVMQDGLAKALAGVQISGDAAAPSPVVGQIDVYWARSQSSTNSTVEAPGIDVTVPANLHWVDSGIVLRQGQPLRISASGAWSNTGPPSIGPAGFVGYHYPGTILASADLASLIGRVGNETFAIGGGFSGFSPADGHLLLSINDTPDTFGDNQGFLKVTIRLN